jgi:hypothetical protein
VTTLAPPAFISNDYDSAFYGVTSAHITPEKASELEAKWRRLEVVQSLPYKKYRDEWLVVLRSPSRVEFKQWQASVDSPNPMVKNAAAETITMQLLVFPEPAQVQAWLETYPSLVVVCGHAVSRLMGLEGEASGKP